MRISDWSSDVCSSDLLDERQYPVVERDQVDFPGLAAQVPSQNGQAATLQVTAGAFFRGAPRFLCGRGCGKLRQWGRAWLGGFRPAAPGTYRFLLGEAGQCVGECVVRHASPLFKGLSD